MSTDSKAKYTPGPWTINEWHDEDWSCYHEEDGTSSHKQVHAASGRVVGFAAYHTHKLWGTHKEDAELEANARLISAAPDQHAALQATQLLLERLGLESSDEYQRNAAAIAKALGGAS